MLARRQPNATRAAGRLWAMGGSLVLAVVVAVAVALFAHAFREAAFMVLDRLGGSSDAIEVVRAAPPFVRVLVVSGGLVAASVLARVVTCRWHARTNIRALAASASGEHQAPGLGVTLATASSTWLATVGMASLGRETAIIETGGSLGGSIGRRRGGAVAELSAAGIAAAFSAAYHAPLAALLYVEHHLGARRRPSTMLYAAVGSLTAHAFMVTVIGAAPLLPRGVAPLSQSGLAWSALALVPAFVASRAFLSLRERFVTRHPRESDPPPARWGAVAVAAVVGGLLVALLPVTAGNGLEALRETPGRLTLAMAAALVLGKAVATTASLATGTPGGVFSPSLAVAAGAALAVFVLVAHVSGPLGAGSWDGLLVAMAIGIATSVRAPLVAAVVVAEMTADLRLLPLGIVASVLAWSAGRWWDRRQTLTGHEVPADVHDEDG